MAQTNEVATAVPQGSLPESQISNQTPAQAAAGYPSLGQPIGYNGALTVASLYVGELKPEITEQTLWNIFAQCGQLLSIKVCRHSTTQASLGYAYVNFRTPQEAATALEKVNYMQIDGKSCRVMWSMRDNTRRKFGIGNLFIKNIDHTLDAKSLCQAFSTFGPVLSCKIATDEYGVSKGYGFVQFYNENDAEFARERANGLVHYNKKLSVCKFISKQERKDAKPINPEEFTNIFVKNFGKLWTEDDMRKKFEIFGEITSLAIKKVENGESQGFGFVNFVKHESAAKAVNELNDIPLENGNKLCVCRAVKKHERVAHLRRVYEERKRENFKKTQNMNLYVKNFDESFTEPKLSEMFKEFGEIISCHIMKDEVQRSKCFGFVCFSKPEEAQKAIDGMHLKMLDGRPLYVSIAQSKEDRLKLFQQNSYNNSFRSIIAPQGGVQFVYPAPGAFPYPSQPQFARFQQTQIPNRVQPRGIQQGPNQPGQQYIQQNVQRNYNYPQNGGYQQNYRPRNSNSGGMGRNNQMQSSYQPRYQHNQPPAVHQPTNQNITLSVNQVASDNAPRTKREESRKQLPKDSSVDVRTEFKDRVYFITKEVFSKSSYDGKLLGKVAGILCEHYGDEIANPITSKDQEITVSVTNVYHRLIKEEKSYEVV